MIKYLTIILLLLSSNLFAQPWYGNGHVTIEYSQSYDLAPRYFSVTDYGAVNDSTVNSTASIQRTIDSADRYNGIVFFPPGKYTASALTLPDSTIIQGYGAKLNYLAGQTGSLLTMDSVCQIYGLTLDGGTYSYDSTTAEGNRTGISVSSRGNCQFFYIMVKGFNKRGIEFSTSSFNEIAHCKFRYNFASIYIAGGGEYININGGKVQHSKYGIFVGGGNNPVTGVIIEKCVYGIYMVAGSNAAHSGFVNCEITHCTTANVFITGLVLPESFIGCHIYSGRLWIINSVTTIWQGIDMGSVDFIVDNSNGLFMGGATADTSSSTVTFTELNPANFHIMFVYDMAGTLVSWND